MRKIFCIVIIIMAAPAMMILCASAEPPVAAFSTLKSGQALPSSMHFVHIPQAKHNTVSLVADEGATVLRIESNNSAGSVALPLVAESKVTPLLTWRWKVSRVLNKADMEEKSKDDFSGRVYVFFDVPLASLSFSERTKIRLARVATGQDVPTAALCYVWDNKHRIGFANTSPYTKRMHKIVVESGPEKVGQWVTETRDIAADFRRLFGHEPPRITGVAVGNDTDNTDESVTTWFGDVLFQEKK